jgi:hypothetical protein
MIDTAPIKKRVDELAKRHGSLRAAARVLKLTPAYLSRLRSGEKINPSDKVLKKLGLRRSVEITFMPIGSYLTDCDMD